MSTHADDAFAEPRPADATARLELVERQSLQLNGNSRWLMEQLEEVRQLTRELRKANEDLRDEIGILRGQARKEAKEPDVNNPPMYEGDQSSLETWITACQLKFAGQPSRFITERQKLVFATSYLKGPPLSWINPALGKYLTLRPDEEPPTELSSFEEFTRALKTLYGDPNLERNALTALDNLKQTTSVANYISRFAVYSQHAHLNDVGLRQAFYKGLKSGIKDELATRDYATLKELQTLATKLDARLRERSLESRTESPTTRSLGVKTSSPLTSSRPSTATPSIAPIPRSAPLTSRPSMFSTQPPAAPPAPATDGTTPMELDNLRVGKLTPTEKERCRREGRCFRCREPGHLGAFCPHYLTIAEIEVTTAENGEGQE